MSIPFSKLHPRETFRAAEVVETQVVSLTDQNAFLNEALVKVRDGKQMLLLAMNKGSIADLTVQVNESDRSFDSHLCDVRAVLSAKAGIALLGEEATASAELLKDIKDLGGTFERFTRDKQIASMDALIEKWQQPQKQRALGLCGIAQIFSAAVTDHEVLKQRLEQRATISASDEEIPTEWEAGRLLASLLSMVYTHIHDYAQLGNKTYSTILIEIQKELLPMTTQVRSRKGHTERTDNA